MELKEKLVKKFQSAYNHFHGKNGVYTEIAYIDLPEKSLRRMAEPDNHYSLFLSNGFKKYVILTKNIVSDLGNQFTTCFTDDEKISLLRSEYKECAKEIKKNPLYRPDLEIIGQIDFNQKPLLLLSTFKNLFYKADITTCRDYLKDKPKGEVKPSQMSNASVMLCDFEYYHEKNLTIFDAFLKLNLRLKFVSSLLEFENVKPYLLYFNNYFGYQVIKQFKRIYDKEKYGPSELKCLRELIEKEYHKNEPLGRKKTTDSDYLKVMNDILESNVSSLNGITAAKKPNIKSVFKKCIKFCKSDI